MQNNIDTVQLRQQLSAAFPSSHSLSHLDCEKLRTELLSLRDEDVPAFLGLVLIDLVETHTDSMARPDWADSVVRFLSAAEPPPVKSIVGGSFDTKQFSDFSASIQPDAEALFRKFTIEQSRAIYRWLEAAQLWKESQIPADELVAALKYWKKRKGDD